MFFSRYAPVAGAALAALCAASPMPMPVDNVLALAPSRNELAIREAMDRTIHTPYLEKRLDTEFSMEKTWTNDVLFAG